MISFAKTQALGNDFILVENLGGLSADLTGLARAMCDRHFGIGGDGLILWQNAGGDFNLRIFNCDGSEAECSGNGLRCVAAYLIESGRWPRDEVRLRTISGVYLLRRIGTVYEADMGIPALAPEQIPFIPPAPMDRVVGCPIDIGGQTVPVTACATGNPHCSVFVDELEPALVQRLGPLLESHPAFPRRTNVEFIRVLNENEIEVAFWERGVGLTCASGTGSCGATVASVLNGKTRRKVTVHTTTGTLQVEWTESSRLMLTATARVVAEGTYLENRF